MNRQHASSFLHPFLFLAAIFLAGSTAQSQVSVSSWSSPAAVRAGEPATVEVTVANELFVPALFRIIVALSRDGSFDNSVSSFDTGWYTAPPRSLFEPGHITVSLPLGVPINLGTRPYWFVVRQVSWPDATFIEDHFRVCDGIGIPDLTFNANSSAPQTVNSASQVGVSARVVNEGYARSPITSVTIRLMHETLGRNDLLSTSTIPDLAPGETWNVGTVVRMPMDWPAGPCHVVLSADPTNLGGERNLANNHLHLGTMQYVPLPDLLVRSMDQVWQPSGDLFLRIHYANQGQAACPPHQMGFYLSSNETITLGDFFIFHVDLPALPPLGDGVFEFEFPTTAFVPMGMNWAGVYLDRNSAVLEGRENNNGKSFAMTVAPVGADLAIESFQLGTDSIHENGTTHPVVVVKNLGTIASPAGLRMGYFLSSDAAITSTDRLLMEFPLPELPPGVSYPIQIEVPTPAPLAAGMLHFGVLLDIDHSIPEFSYANNMASIEVVSYGFDWQGTQLDAVTLEGSGCGVHRADVGGSLFPTDPSNARLSARLHNSIPNGIGFLLIGGSPLPVPITLPEGGCQLLIEPLVIHGMIFLDIRGNGSMDFLLSAARTQGFLGQQLFFQFAVLDTMHNSGIWLGDAMGISFTGS